jgi:hypothetical protein
MADNSAMDILIYLNKDSNREPITSTEFLPVWKSLSDEEKAAWRKFDLS